MNVEQSYIRELIIEYFLDHLDDGKKEELWEWLKKDKKHEVLFKKYVQELYILRVADAWDSVPVEKAKERVLRKLRPALNIWKISGVAVVLVVFVSIVFLWLYRQSGDVFVERKIFSELTQQSSKFQAILSVGDNRKVVLNGTERKLIHADSNSLVFVNDEREVCYKNVEQEEIQKIEMHSLEVPKGSEFKIVLGDGTQVWMNAQTKLSYPESFQGERREVFLAGEAYFEVAYDVEKPFVVKTADMGITVLGTSFNVKAYPEDEYVITTLVTGSVSQEYIKSGKEVVLSPSDQAIYTKSNGVLKVGQVDVNESISWKDGRIILKDCSLKEIFRELVRWYDFEVEYRKEGLENTRFYINMDRYDDVRAVLDKLQKTNGVKFMFYDRKIIVYDNSMLK